jgi:excisionase family DNA binding protein
VSAKPLERYCTTRELAEALRLNPETIRRAARRGELRSVRIGHERRYPESAVKEWLELLASRGDRDWRPAA